MESSILDPVTAQLVTEATSAYSPSQAELANEIGVQPLALTTWRRGRSRPTADHLRGLATALERQGERLRELALRVEAHAAVQGKLTRGPRRVQDPFRAAAELWTARMVAEGRGDVLRVIFYGSRSRAAPRSSTSDWDFVVVLNHVVTDVEAEERRFRRAALEGPSPVGNVVLDVWPIEQGEWETVRQLYGHPARAADREGVVLYAAG